MWRHRKKLILLTSLIAVLYGMYFLADWGVSTLEERLNALIDELRGEGYEISYDKLAISGTPFSVKAEVLNPKVKHHNNLFYVVGPAIDVSMSIWNPSTMMVDFKGSHVLQSSLLSENIMPKIMLDGGKLDLKFNTDIKVTEINLYADHLVGMKHGQTLPFSMHVLTARLGDLENPLESWGDISFKVIGLDKTLGISRGNNPMEFNLSYALKGITDDLGGNPDLVSWRDKGGVVDVLDLRINWEGMSITGNGTITVDEELRPLGSFSATFVNYDKILEVMVQAGYAKQKSADAVNFALHLLAGEPEVGKREISIPLTMQNGELRIGPAKLMKLDPVVVN